MSSWFERQVENIIAYFHGLLHGRQVDREIRLLKESDQILIAVLEGIDAGVFVSDFETDEILFANKHFRDSFDDDLVGRKCYQIFRNETYSCAHCNNNKLLDANGQPTGGLLWESYNPITGRWYKNSDKAIRWGDGRFVHLQIATDITEHKQAQEEIQKQMQVQVSLRKAGAAISSSLNIRTVLSHIAEEMGRAIDVTSAYINSYEPTIGMSLVLAEYFAPDANPEERVSDLDELYMEDGNKEFLELMHTGHYDITSTGSTNLSKYEQAEMQRCGIQSILYIPLQIRGDLIGYAELWETRRQREFSFDEITICQDLAQQAAIAIENARSYEQAQLEIVERKWAELELQRANNQLQTHIAEIKKLEAALREQAIRDPLTGLYNRRYMEDVLEKELARASRKNEPLSIVILDLDELKMINDTYGHIAGGDKALQKLASTLLRLCRAEDILCRYAGDEFLVILHDTPAEVAYKRALQWKEAISRIEVVSNGRIFNISFSAGVASFPLHGSTEEQILIQADNALYHAKEFGRDRIVVYQEKSSV